ncbi:hypothetical protein JKG47_04720 [Acidithiobacillus sp. MC6.1]|nr:hypothetical protein [Acidithiobacillus sp. MC6.1]
MKTVIFSHGDKGGVGKSVVAAAMVDSIITRMGCCTVLDGDNKTPDLRNRFRHAPSVTTIHMQLNMAGAASDAVSLMAGIVEEAVTDFIVVNLPSSAGDTLDGMGRMLRAVFDDIDVRMAVTYSLGEHDEAADGLTDSLCGRFLSVFDPDDRMVLFPAFLGPKNSFKWVGRKAYLEYMGLQAVFPAIEPKRIFNDIIQIPGLFSDMVEHKPKEFTAYHRIALKEWLEETRQVLDALLFPSRNGINGEA